MVIVNEGGDKASFCIARDHMFNESRDSVGEIRGRELKNKNMYLYYKLGQACVTNWGSFVLLQIRGNVVTNWGNFIITNRGKCCCKLGAITN